MCPVVVGPFRDFSPKTFVFLYFFEVFSCFVSLFRDLEMPVLFVR